MLSPVKVVEKRLRFVLLAVLFCASPLFSATGDILTEPTYLAWQNHTEDSLSFSVILNVDNGFLLKADGAIFRLSSDGQQILPFGAGGATAVNQTSQLARGVDDQWYVATVSGETALDGQQKVRIGLLGKDGSLRYNWAGVGELVSAVLEEGTLDPNFSLVVDDEGIYFFAMQVDDVADTSSIFYAAWNLDGTEKVLTSGSNTVTIPVSQAEHVYRYLVVKPVDSEWLMYAENGVLLDDVVAVRFDKMGSLSSGFADAGMLKVTAGRPFVTAGSFIYLLDYVANAESKLRIMLRRFDLNGIEDTAYGTNEVLGLPLNSQGNTVTVSEFDTIGGELYLSQLTSTSDEQTLTRWRLDADSYTASEVSNYVWSGSLCTHLCKSEDGRNSLIHGGADGAPNQLLVYEGNGEVSQIELGALTSTRSEGLVHASPIGLGGRLLWVSGYRRCCDAKPALLFTDLNGRADLTLGEQGKSLIGDDGHSYATDAFIYDGKLLVHMSGYLATCGGEILGIPDASASQSLAWVSASGDWLKERGYTNLKGALVDAGGDSSCKSGPTKAIGVGRDGVKFSLYGDVYHVSGENLDSAFQVVDQPSNTDYLPVRSPSGQNGFIQMVRAAGPHDEVSAVTSLQFLNNDLIIDSAFNGGNPLQLASLFTGTDCIAGVYRVLADSLGRFYVAGNVKCDGQVNIYILRLLADGSIDASYGDEGMIVAEQNWAGASVTDIDLIAQTDEKLLFVVSGARVTDLYEKLRVMRYHTNGDLDTGFSGDGILYVDELGDNAGKDHTYAQLVYSRSGNLNLFYMRDGGVSMMEIEGDSPGPREEVFFKSAQQPQSSGSSGGAIANFWLLLAFCLIGLRVRLINRAACSG